MMTSTVETHFCCRKVVRVDGGQVGVVDSKTKCNIEAGGGVGILAVGKFLLLL